VRSERQAVGRKLDWRERLEHGAGGEHPAPQLGYAAEYIADMDGYFKKEGLTVKANTARGSAPAIQAVLSGHGAALVGGLLESVIDIANQNAPIQSIAFTGRRSTLAIVSDKSKPMAKPQDLVGNRIGIRRKAARARRRLDLLLASNNIPVDKVPRQVTGFAPGTYELIKKGRIAGFVIGASRRSNSARPSRPPRSCTPPTSSPTD